MCQKFIFLCGEATTLADTYKEPRARWRVHAKRHGGCTTVVGSYDLSLVQVCRVLKRKHISLGDAMRKAVLVALMIIGVTAVVPTRVQAVPIVGTLDIAGAVRVTNTGLIDWVPPVGMGFGMPVVQPTTIGYFAPLIGFTVREADLSAAAFPAGPPGTFAPLSGFQTFPGTPLPGLNFTLTGIDICEVGCGFGFAPQFNVVFTGGNTSVIMNVRGTVTDSGNPGELSNWVGQFTAQFPGQSPSDLIAQLLRDGFIDTSFSASKISTAVPTIPEPATLLTFATGAALLAWRRRRINS